MKFMKLGLNPDIFYTEETTRTVLSDVPTDLTIRIDGMTYLLHKSCLVPKCGLLQRLFPEKDENGGSISVDLHDVPGGEEAFELCAKFCYGITISLSAHNFVPALCAASFLCMTEKFEHGNLTAKLEAFFSSCILQAWKDTLVALQNAERLHEWCGNLGIVRRCVESIVDKILTPPTKVRWSYTYTRPGYIRKRRKSVPKDWWTEDLSCLGIDMFSSIVTAISSTNMLNPQLIGEALHVYAHCWLFSSSRESPNRKRKILETIVKLIPAEKGSVSVKFLLRLLSATNSLGASPVSKAELLRLSGLQLHEATLPDLLLPNAAASHDVDLVKTVAWSFLRQWKRRSSAGERDSLREMHKVGKLIDSYLQVVAKDARMPAHKMVALIETLPAIARPQHDHLYKAINIYLKAHPDVSKANKKHLCSFLDCQKLSPEVRSHASKNERLPLRTVVQVLFFEQEKSNTTASKVSSTAAEEQCNGTRPKAPGTNRAQLSKELSFRVKVETEKDKKREAEGDAAPQLNPHNKAQMRSLSKMSYIKR